MVMGEDLAESWITLKPGEKVVVAVFERLAVDGWVLAALYEH